MDETEKWTDLQPKLFLPKKFAKSTLSAVDSTVILL